MPVAGGVFVKNITGADGPTVAQVACCAELVIPTWVPIEGYGNILRQQRSKPSRLPNGFRSQSAPVRIVGVEFEVPIGCGPVGDAENRVQRKGQIEIRGDAL